MKPRVFINHAMRCSALSMLLCAGGCITMETQEDIAAQQAQQQAHDQAMERANLAATQAKQAAAQTSANQQQGLAAVQAAHDIAQSQREHNLAQQIYVSKNVWETVKSVKEQEINMVIQVAQTLNPEAPAKDLHTRILEILLRTDQELPTAVALQIINEEVKIVMSFGSIQG